MTLGILFGEHFDDYIQFFERNCDECLPFWEDDCMEKSYLRGHKIELLNGEWVFSDTKESTVETWQKRPCGHCGKHNTTEGHDGCLGTLKGVMNACCGHGQINDAYVQFLDGFSIHGKDAITIMKILKKSS